MPEEQTAPAPQPAPSGQPAAQPAKAGDDNLIAAVSYISILSVVILLIKKDSDYVQFHAKQGLVLFIGEVIIWVLSIAIWVLFFLWWLIGLVFLVASIAGFIKALGGEKFRLPVVADIADKINI